MREKIGEAGCRGKEGSVAAPVLRRQVERLRSLPTLPATVQRIADLIDDPAADLGEVAALIESDQVLAAQVLRLANSAFYGLSGQIGSLTHALAILGTAVTKSLLLSTSVLDLRIDMAGFWEHSVGVATAACALAKQLRLRKPEEVSGAGLLHDLGKVVLYKQAPDAFAAVLAEADRSGCSFREAEWRLLGVDHTTVAGWLCPRWNFPVRLREPIVHHHQPERAPTARVEASVVHIADVLVRAYGYGFGGDRSVPSPSRHAWELLGLRAQVLDAVLERFEWSIECSQESAALW